MCCSYIPNMVIARFFFCSLDLSFCVSATSFNIFASSEFGVAGMSMHSSNAFKLQLLSLLVDAHQAHIVDKRGDFEFAELRHGEPEVPAQYCVAPEL